MELTALLTKLPTYQLSHHHDDITITAITEDSRQVEPGTLFVAYGGVSVDGHQFIQQAIANGARAIIGEQVLSAHLSVPYIQVPDGREALAYLSAAWHDFPAQSLTMVGITGTDGKTTTTNLLYHLLNAGQFKTSMVSTVNAVIGDTISDTGLHTTTPTAPEVQRYLYHMVQAETDICLLEVTSHGLAHHRVTACDFDVAVVTNITHEHLDAHQGSLTNYRAAKAMLFEGLATAYQKKRPKLAVLNCDDWSFDYLKSKLAPHKIPWLGYSINNHPEATLLAMDIHYQADYTQFTVHQHTQSTSQTTSITVRTHLIGDYNVSNSLAAIAVAWCYFELPPATIQQGALRLSGIPGRMERIDEGQPFLAIVDFAHTPNSLRRTLQVAQTLTPGQVIAVFGCAGLRDVEKRTMMGQVAAGLADITILTAEDPRTETLTDIIAETATTMLAQGAIEGQTFQRIPDRGRAIYQATQLAQPDDVVLVLGKGHEQSMCFGTTEYPWDDSIALRTALKGQPLLTLPTA